MIDTGRCPDCCALMQKDDWGTLPDIDVADFGIEDADGLRGWRSSAVMWVSVTARASVIVDASCAKRF